MKQKMLFALAQLLMLGVVVLVPVTSASAASPGCVTRAEFKRARTGMTQAHVHHIFGTPGVFGGHEPGGHARFYKECRTPPPNGEDCRAVVSYKLGADGLSHLRHKYWNGYCG